MLFKIIFIVIALLWVGMVLGIMLESAAKFRTPGLTKALGLEVGRVVFKAFHRVQIFLLVVVVIFGLLSCLSIVDCLMLFVLVGAVLLQEYLLLPKLSRRIDLIQMGKEPPKSLMHSIYAIMELAKLFLLLWLAINTLLTIG